MTDRTLTEDELLNRLKKRDEPGAMRPRLCEILQIDGKAQPPLTLQWMYYAGMGDCGFRDASPEQKTVAATLLEKGFLAPSLPFTYYDLRCRQLNLIEDIHWALDGNDDLVLFDLSRADGIPDQVIRPDSDYDAAVERVRMLQKYNRIVLDAPLRLDDARTLRPLIFDRDQAEIRRRQQHCEPGRN